MRKIFDEVTNRMRSFLTQHERLALVVRSVEGETPAILKILETLEEECNFALFWQYPESFVTAQEYVDVIQESFVSKHELVRLLQQQENMYVWPAFPEQIRLLASPSERLKAMMVFARSLLPTLEGGLLVWVLFPADVADPQAYAQLMREVVQHNWPFPWCHHMRIIVRNDPACLVFTEMMAQEQRIDWFAPDLSTHAIENALQEEVDDSSLPLEERLQSLLLTAGMDHSHRRYALALDKYQVLYDHYSSTGNLPMAAVAINGMGEARRDLQQTAEAGACFEAALVAASDGAETSTPILLNVFLNLGNLRSSEKRWSEAESYFDCAQQVAAVLRYADIRIMILEQLGLAQSMQNNHAAAIESWKAGALIATRLEKPGLREQHLSRLRSSLNSTGNTQELNMFMGQLASIEPVSAFS